MEYTEYKQTKTDSTKRVRAKTSANLVHWTEYWTGFDPECLERKIRNSSEKKIGLVNVECAFCAENEFRVQAKRKTCDRRKGFFRFLFPSSRGSGVSRVALCVRATQNRPFWQLLIFKATQEPIGLLGNVMKFLSTYENCKALYTYNTVQAL